MAQKIKNRVQKSVTAYDTVFGTAVWESARISIEQDDVLVSYSLFHDVAEADAEGISINDAYISNITVTVDPPVGRVASVMAVVSGDTNEEKLVTLANAMMESLADIEIADNNSRLFGGTKI